MVHQPNGLQPAESAKQEIDYGRRVKGYTFGALKPGYGEVFTETNVSGSAKNFVDFLEKVDQWLAFDLQVIAILDNLAAHRATDVLLFSLHHSRWQFVFQPKYVAYLNLIEPWWKILRSLTFKGKRFETWEEICRAVQEATQYWNHHRHPFFWGRRRRHKFVCSSGVGLCPNVS